jgi:hypothetical protein
MTSLLLLTKQVSLGVLPACLLASAVPDRIQFWLNIDFAWARKNRPGGNHHGCRSAGQNLPYGAIIAGQRAANTSTFHKRLEAQTAQRLEKLWFTPAQKSMNKYEDGAGAPAMQPAKKEKRATPKRRP